MTDLLFQGRGFVLHSPLTHDEVSRRLEHAITPPAWRLNDRRTEPFEGTFANGRFQVVRRARGRNSFRPLIEGEVAPGQPGTRVEVRMRLHPLVVAVSAVMMAFGLLVATVAVNDAIAARSLVPELVVLPMLGLAALVVAATSRSEVKRALRILRELLAAPAA
jgi:hypothetical protein